MIDDYTVKLFRKWADGDSSSKWLLGSDCHKWSGKHPHWTAAAFGWRELLVKRKLAHLVAPEMFRRGMAEGWMWPGGCVHTSAAWEWDGSLGTLTVLTLVWEPWGKSRPSCRARQVPAELSCLQGLRDSSLAVNMRGKGLLPFCKYAAILCRLGQDSHLHLLCQTKQCL